MKKDHIWVVSGATLLAGSLVFLAIVLTIVFLPRFTEALRPKPEKFTELFFEDHLKLPKTIVSGQVSTVSATIHNLEHETKTYPVEVFAARESAPDTQMPLYTTAITLDHDASSTITVPVILTSDISERMKVTFLLPELEQSIHYWVLVSTISTSSGILAPSPNPENADISSASGILEAL